MADSEWFATLRRTLTPHLQVLKLEIEKLWPTLEPELVLIHWLCQKHNLEPPIIAFKRLDLKEGSLSARRRSQGPEVTKLPPATSPKLPDPTASPWPSVQKPAYATSRSGSKGVQSARVPSSLPAAPGTPTTATPPFSVDRTPQWSANVSLELASGSLSDDGEADERVRWRMHTLDGLKGQVQHDAQNHAARLVRLKQRDANVTDLISNMRHELRGAFLKQVPLLSFGVLTAEEQWRLVGKLRPWTFCKNYNVVTEGEVGDKLYIIECGTCEAIKNHSNSEVVVGRMGKGAFFGEIAAFYDVPRTATVRTLSSVTALSLSRSDLVTSIRDKNLQRMHVIARTQVFSSIPLLSKLDGTQMVRVAEALKRQRFLKGSVIAKQNHITSRLHIIEKGTISQEAPDKQTEPNSHHRGVKPKNLGPGHYFGMRGLLYGAPVGYTITATSDEVVTLTISYEELLGTVEPSQRMKLQSTLRASMQGFLLRQIPQVTHLSDNFFQTVQAHAKEVTFPKWAVIQSKGSPIEMVYVLEEGKLVEHDENADTLQEDQGIKASCPEQANPGEYFGVECLTNKRARAAKTLVALTDVSLLQVPPEVIWAVLHEERQHISRIPLLSQDVLSKAEQYILVGKLKPWNFPSGRNIITQGEIGDMLFIIERGVCDAIKEIDGREVIMSQLKKGAFFGELAVMYDTPRTATVRAATDVVAVSLSREDLRTSIGQDKLEKMRTIARTQVFTSIPILADLKVKHKIGVAHRMRTDRFEKGHIIVQPSQSTDRMYIVEKGEVRSKTAEGAEERLIPFRFFGMEGLLYSAPYGCMATVASDYAITLSVSLGDILDAAGTGERPSMERALTDSMRCHLLRQIPHLECKGDEYFHTLLNHVEVVRYSPGDVVFPRGFPLSTVYVLERGRLAEAHEVDPDKEYPSKHELCPGRELSHILYGTECVTDCHHTARVPTTIVALEECSLLKVPAAVVRS